MQLYGIVDINDYTVLYSSYDKELLQEILMDLFMEKLYECYLWHVKNGYECNYYRIWDYT